MGDRALLLLDAHEAFDSVEWWWKFGFRAKFPPLVRLLYSSPQAVIRVAEQLSPTFSLGRGTLQGCSLSPLLFAIAIEPLVVVNRSNPAIVTFNMGKYKIRSCYMPMMIL